MMISLKPNFDGKLSETIQKRMSGNFSATFNPTGPSWINKFVKPPTPIQQIQEVIRVLDEREANNA